MFDLDVYPAILESLAISDAVSLLLSSRRPCFSTYLWRDALRRQAKCTGIVALPKGKNLSLLSDVDLRRAAFKTAAISNKWSRPRVAFNSSYSFHSFLTPAEAISDPIRFMFNIPGARVALFYYLHEVAFVSDLTLLCLDLETGARLCPGLTIRGVCSDLVDDPKIRESGVWYGDGELTFAFFSERVSEDSSDETRFYIDLIRLCYGERAAATMEVTQVLTIVMATDNAAADCYSREAQVLFDGKTVIFAACSKDHEKLYYGCQDTHSSLHSGKLRLKSIPCTWAGANGDLFALFIVSSVVHNGILNLIALAFEGDDNMYIGGMKLSTATFVKFKPFLPEAVSQRCYLVHAGIVPPGHSLCIMATRNASFLALAADEEGSLSPDLTVKEAVWREMFDRSMLAEKSWLEYPTNGSRSLLYRNDSDPYVRLLTPRQGEDGSICWTTHVLALPDEVTDRFEESVADKIELDEHNGTMIVAWTDGTVHVVSFI